jgi:agmatinase
MLLRPYEPVLGVDVFPNLSVVDRGDLDLTPGNAERTTQQIASGLGEVVAGGTVPILLGGDHLVTVGALRAQAAAHGPVAVVLLDAHADTWDQYYGERYFHGTVFRRAVEEGLVAPERSLLAGMRGSLYSDDDLAAARELGFELITGEELGQMAAAEYGHRVRERVRRGPAYLSFDIDVVDPAFAPATGTPEVGGLTAREALGFIRSLAGMRFGGFDLVEVSPPYDGPGQVTALLAANIAYEFLALTALTR